MRRASGFCQQPAAQVTFTPYQTLEKKSSKGVYTTHMKILKHFALGLLTGILLAIAVPIVAATTVMVGKAGTGEYLL